MKYRILMASIIAISFNASAATYSFGGHTYYFHNRTSSGSTSGSTSGGTTSGGTTSGGTTSGGTTSGGTTSGGTTSGGTTSGGTTSGGTTSGGTTTSSKLGLLVPAYFDPTADQKDWNTLISAAGQTSLIAIMNPNSGPGTSANQAYVNNVNSINSAGGKVVGYVHTSYGSRSLADCEKEVDNYFAWYNVKGIFLDEYAASATTANLNYYKALAAYIRGKSATATIVGNPGGSFDQGFVSNQTADIFVDAEDIQSNVHNMTQPSWVSSYAPGTFAAMSLQTSGDPTETAWLKSHRRMGWVYTTTLSLNPNPYSALPSDFASTYSSL